MPFKDSKPIMQVQGKAPDQLTARQLSLYPDNDPDFIWVHTHPPINQSSGWAIRLLRSDLKKLLELGVADTRPPVLSLRNDTTGIQQGEKKQGRISRKLRLKAIETLQAEFQAGELPKPNQNNNPEGEKIPLGTLEYRRVWAHIEPSGANPRHIWFVTHNGEDGDAWAHCNIADGIGFRLPFSEELAERVKALREPLTNSAIKSMKDRVR